MTKEFLENSDRSIRSGEGSQSVIRWLTVLAMMAYLAFPIVSGAWYYERIECVFMWSEAAKEGLSLGAYVAVGFYIWRKMRPDVLTADGLKVGLLIATAFGVAMLYQVLNRCW